MKTVKGKDVNSPEPEDCVAFLEVDSFQGETTLTLYITHKGFYKIEQCIYDGEIFGPTEDALNQLDWDQGCESCFIKKLDYVPSEREIENLMQSVEALGVTLISEDDFFSGAPVPDEDDYDVPSDIYARAGAVWDMIGHRY